MRMGSVFWRGGRGELGCVGFLFRRARENTLIVVRGCGWWMFICLCITRGKIVGKLRKVRRVYFEK